MTILELLLFGSRFEDVVFPTESIPEIGSIRSLHHFYDPQNNGRGLSPANHAASAFARFLDLESPPDYAVGYPSLSWAIFEKDSLYQIGPSISYRQRFSYENAKDYFFHALTNRDREERRRNFGLLFQTLGHVVHHIQDMAQPQHVRNDAHLPIDNDFYEAFVSDFLSEERLEVLISGGEFGGISYPGSIYDTKKVVLPRAVDYGDFEFLHADRGADRVGMAEYTSTNFTASDVGFVGTETSIFPHPEYPLPEAIAISESYLESGAEASDCGMQMLTYDGRHPVTGKMKWVSSVIVDRLLGEGEPGRSSVNPRAASFSIWHNEIVSRRKSSLDPLSLEMFSVNECVFHERLRHLMPRAVAFSAGLIDHFFRGRIEISQPQEGAYGIRDTYVPGGISLDAEGRTSVSGEVFGFETIRLDARNVTPPVELPDRPPFNQTADGQAKPVSISQDMFDGTLYAVVKYSLNRCYVSDGSGQFGIETLSGPYSPSLQSDINALETRSGCASPDYLSIQPDESNTVFTLGVRRRDGEQIAVSAPILVGESAGGEVQRLPADEPITLAFDFSDDPVPLNATDVRLQVVYRGKLGPEYEALPGGVRSMVEEDAVVVNTIDISEPGDVVVANLTDHFVNLPVHNWAEMSLAEDPEGGEDPPRYTLSLDPQYLLPGRYQMAFQGEGGVNRPIPLLLVDGLRESPHHLRLVDTGEVLGEAGAEYSGEIVLEFFPRDVPEGEINVLLPNGSSIAPDSDGYTYRIDTHSLENGSHKIVVRYRDGEGFSGFQQAFVVNNNPQNSGPAIQPIGDVVHAVTGGIMRPLEVHIAVEDDNGMAPDSISVRSAVPGLIDLNRILRVENAGPSGFTLLFYGDTEYRQITGSPTLFDLYSHIPIEVTVSDGELTSTAGFVYRRVNADLADQGYFEPWHVEQHLTEPSSILVAGGAYASLGDPQDIGIHPIVNLPDYSAGFADLALQDDEGVFQRDEVNARLCSEWQAADGAYDNLADGSLLKKLIDKTALFQSMPGDPGPECAFIPSFGQLDLQLQVDAEAPGPGPLIGIRDLGVGEFARFSVMANPSTRFVLAGGQLGFPYRCNLVRPDIHQWNEEYGVYENQGSARKLGNVYSSTRYMEHLLCESPVSVAGNPALVSDELFTEQMEAALDGYLLDQVGLSDLHPAY